MFAISAPEPKSDPAVGQIDPMATLPTIADVRSIAGPIRLHSYLGNTNPVPNPLFDISPSIANVLAHSKADGSLSSVPPCVQRLDRNIEKRGQILDGEQAVFVGHGEIVRANPVNKVFVTLSTKCS
jgi:hypothetical protein